MRVKKIEYVYASLSKTMTPIRSAVAKGQTVVMVFLTEMAKEYGTSKS